MAQPLSFPSQSRSLEQAATSMLKASKAKLDWKPVDVDTLPKEYADLFNEYRRLAAIASEARTAFEDAICGPLAKMLNAKPGQDVAFTYRFGLAVALTEKAQPKQGAIRF